jgi:hypothetical protein
MLQGHNDGLEIKGKGHNGSLRVQCLDKIREIITVNIRRQAGIKKTKINGGEIKALPHNGF